MNAIILAAGLGTRFKEWTKHNHKSLLPIQGTPNIERTIAYLIQADVEHIYIIVGHMAHQFLYLENKYPQVKLIYNDKYKIYNSIYTFYLALDFFSASWVIDADTVLLENIFKYPVSESTYFTVLRNNEGIEWCPVTKENKVQEILITDQHLPSLSGISYWTNEECQVIKQVFDTYMVESTLLNNTLYWDNIVKDVIHLLNVAVVQLRPNSVFEMDNQIDYYKICDYIIKH